MNTSHGYLMSVLAKAKQSQFLDSFANEGKENSLDKILMT